MTDREQMHRIDQLLSHVWMVRTFIKHSEEFEDDDDLREVQRDLYDTMLSLGAAWKDQDAEAYLKQIRKKLKKLQNATQLFVEIQPEVSSHMNFQMAARSLEGAVGEIVKNIEK